jgi:hypothetical protein
MNYAPDSPGCTLEDITAPFLCFIYSESPPNVVIISISILFPARL